MPSNAPDVKALGEKIDEALTPHAVLGIPRDASSGETRAAYIELVKEFHPDAHPDDPLAERRFLRIQEAYSRLKSSYPLFGAYKAADARSHRHVLWLALTVFALAPAAVLLATYRLREAPGPMQVKANTEARSDFSPKAKKRPQATPRPRRHKVKGRKARLLFRY
jgi:curved DNA-binding protein CbpA